MHMLVTKKTVLARPSSRPRKRRITVDAMGRSKAKTLGMMFRDKFRNIEPGKEEICYAKIKQGVKVVFNVHGH